MCDVSGGGEPSQLAVFLRFFLLLTFQLGPLGSVSCFIIGTFSSS